MDKKIVDSVPEACGVYIFKDKARPIYIGKAINLKRRVRSYFDNDLLVKTRLMVGEATDFAYIVVGSELEALLLEAKLIHDYQPKYNIIAKDDKHPLYIKITKEEYPRVITVRKDDDKPTRAIFGPFPSSRNVYSVLRLLRRIFPYADHKLGNRACIYAHIGLCNPCPNEIEKLSGKEKLQAKKVYLKNIKSIVSILSGKIDKVRSSLEKEMNALSKEEKFEEAKTIRDKIEKLDYITRDKIPVEDYLENPNLNEDLRKKEVEVLEKVVRKLINVPKNISHIECYDVAHLAGTFPTASMVTFVDGTPDKSRYRHFRIKKAKGGDDYKSLKEVAVRRKKHLTDWGSPDLILVDGGKGQVSMFYDVFGNSIPVVGIAKKFETLIVPKEEMGKLIFVEERLPKGPALSLVQRLRDEAHRFARVYHHKLLTQNMLSAPNVLK